MNTEIKNSYFILQAKGGLFKGRCPDFTQSMGVWQTGKIQVCLREFGNLMETFRIWLNR